jgi:membrane-associated phospholipid phosphatase
MTRYSFRTCTFAVLTATTFSLATPAVAQTEPAGAPAATVDETRAVDTSAAAVPAISLTRVFHDLFGDFKRLPSRGTAVWLTLGAGTAALSRPVDTRVSDLFAPTNGGGVFSAGALIGGTPLQLGAAFATYAIGRATDSPRAWSVGADLVRAQLVAQTTTVAFKYAFGRVRPDGSARSFPSGHTAVSFASATVLDRYFGWKAGVPAFALASYVAASRVETRRHYLSDVAFGAALGIAAGRTVTVGVGSARFAVAPAAAPGGGGISLTWTPRK